ncbi:S24 family peptidase [Sphingomonas sp. KR1UV-12]|uniref:S24 family peptidase n=1 Tax=Sphingomonas aurea TaxID=3063994 RepID=A0ABT9EGE2_9SPHN|nr:S24 family peptidase [Sphingomonas sp. KR1UV-12]MDP1025846.1 S24 family peptidase [Sphingomonas sp. KR1UV-12]
MATVDPRSALAALAEGQGVSLSALSRMLGRNVAYLQQYVRRGTPRRLEDEDRQRLAAFFGVGEEALGGPGGAAAAWRVPRLDVAVSAGPGALVDAETVLGSDLIDPALARRLGLAQGQAAILRVRGTSMAPGLVDGDQILIDTSARTPGSRGAAFVIRIGEVLMVKRVRATANGLVATSDNPQAPPVPDGEIAVIGRVVWQMRAVA